MSGTHETQHTTAIIWWQKPYAPNRRASTQHLAHSSAALGLIRQSVKACTSAVGEVARGRCIKVRRLHCCAVNVAFRKVGETLLVCIAANIEIVREPVVCRVYDVVDVVITQRRKVVLPRR